ncbi:HERV-H LTR-associating protein 1, partial [Clarias magur]
FTAILLDVMGNSTSYLQELFKSSSILSVNQIRSSDCIYICVMAGKTDSDQSELWDSVLPLFNHTIMEHTHTAISADFPASSTIHPDISLTSSTSFLMPTTTTAATSFATLTVSTTGHVTAAPSAVSVVTSRVNTTGASLETVSMRTVPASALVPTSAQTSPARSTAAPPEAPATTSTQPAHSSVSMTTTPSAHPMMADTATEVSKPVPSAAKTSPATSRTPHVDKPGCPWQSELIYRGSQRKDQKETLDEALSVNNPTVSSTKLQPCVFELCKFFSQCLCRGFSQKTSLQRYCIDSHFWYEKHTVEVCSRVRRLSFSKKNKLTATLHNSVPDLITWHCMSSGITRKKTGNSFIVLQHQEQSWQEVHFMNLKLTLAESAGSSTLQEVAVLQASVKTALAKV